MRRVIFCVVTAALALTLTGGPGFAANTSPGMNAVFASLNAFPVPGPATPLLVTSLTPGSANEVLAVEAMLTSALFAPNVAMALHLNVDVNGIPMEPSLVSPLGVVADCGGLSLVPVPPASCTAIGTWWLDLSAAGLVGVKLTITLTGGNLFPTFPFPVDVTMTVRKVRK